MCLNRRSILRRGGVKLKGERMAEHVKDCHGETKLEEKQALSDAQKHRGYVSGELAHLVPDDRYRDIQAIRLVHKQLEAIFQVEFSHCVLGIYRNDWKAGYFTSLQQPKQGINQQPFTNSLFLITTANPEPGYQPTNHIIIPA